MFTEEETAASKETASRNKGEETAGTEPNQHCPSKTAGNVHILSRVGTQELAWPALFPFIRL